MLVMRGGCCGDNEIKNTSHNYNNNGGDIIVTSFFNVRVV